MNRLPPYHLTSTLPGMNVAGQRVLLRIDGNVPLDGTTILDDTRLQAIRPTLDWLVQHRARVLIVTHLGRPKHPDPALSTRILIPWFEAHGYPITWAPDFIGANHALQNHTLVLLENIRFWPEERSPHMELAQQLRQCSDIYVNDAFGALHRIDTSIVLLATLYGPEKRTIGFLVQRELSALNRLQEHPTHPFIVIIGGGKVATKLPLIKHLLQSVDRILLLPAISNAFADAQQLPVGSWPVENDYRAQAAAMLDHDRDKILLPQDYIVSDDDFAGNITTAQTERVQAHQMIINIGPQTLAQYDAILATAKTIFFNGAAGDQRYRKTIEPSLALLDAMAKSNAFRVIAGGDTVSLANSTGRAASADILSTGGGATLQYLSGRPLPGLDPFF